MFNNKLPIQTTKYFTACNGIDFAADLNTQYRPKLKLTIPPEMVPRAAANTSFSCTTSTNNTVIKKSTNDAINDAVCAFMNTGFTIGSYTINTVKQYCYKALPKHRLP